LKTISVPRIPNPEISGTLKEDIYNILYFSGARRYSDYRLNLV
jgi:hypothetical protein